MTVLAWIGLGIIAYLIGSIPFGYLAARLVTGVDIRERGSGSTGATNVLRTAGLVPSLVVAVADLGKGVLAAALGIWLLDPAWGPVLTSNLAVIGHCWPIGLSFRGGRGVLTGLGALFVLSPWVGLAALVGAALLMAATRYVSAGSLLGVLIGMAGLTILGITGSEPLSYLAFAWVGGSLIVIRHRKNIQRLLQGTENKLGQRSNEGVKQAWQR